MQNRLAFLASGLALVTCASAQTPLGTFTNTGTTYATRGANAASNTNPTTLFTRHDKEHYAGWTDGVTPNSREVVGLNFVLQDQDLSTQEMFNLVVWSGDPTNPDFPDITTGMVSLTPLGLPIGTGGGAYNASGNFATPVSLTSTEDVYVGIQINSPWTIAGGVVTDGLSVWECRSTPPTTPQPGQQWDLPGAGLPLGSQTMPVDRFSGYYVPSPLTGPDYSTPATQFKIQPIVPNSGGVAGAVTNQTNHPQSTAGAVASFTVQAPGAGTANMFSGLHPDAANPAFNPGRVDDLSQMFENGALPVGSLVFFLIDIGGFAPFEIPAANFVPGSTGVSCLNLTAQNLGFAVLVAVGTTRRAHRVTSFPAAARPLVAGIPFVQQAVALDVTNNTIHAGPCTRQNN